ncbi:hypothetical protein [Pedobacter sp. BS3]|uniref:hypothetical protein n=1 Tax=Pedobacter sp. BS3 TaxID=2567937 RepID=UPI0016590478|nr:hypothetical protein [Pedobacter sp. BS3]
MCRDLKWLSFKRKNHSGRTRNTICKQLIYKRISIMFFVPGKFLYKFLIAQATRISGIAYLSVKQLEFAREHFANSGYHQRL